MRIRFLFLATACVTTVFTVTAQSYKFDFGSGAPVNGYTKITPTSIYDNVAGYGFFPGASVRAIQTKSGKGITKDLLTAAKPFFFSVRLPEGNYTVKIILGDADGSSATTVRAENRRLFLPHIVTAKGAVTTRTFTVHIRDSMIRNTEKNITGKVKLKSRESGYLHWDDKLTLEFNDSLIKVCAVEIAPAEKTIITLFLAGNSTVVDQDKEPWAAWGQMFPSFFEPGNICVANYAESGETLKAFKGERRLEKIMSMAKEGDYLFIEFAHNDQKAGSSHLDPFTTYKSTLKEWITEARNRKMIPVLVTSMHRRSFDAEGHIVNTLSDFPEAMRQTAKEENVALVDLNAMSKILYEAWGPERSLKAFVHFPANTFPGQDSALKDNTHFTTYGAYELARCVLKGLRDAGLPIAKYIKKGTMLFDPAKPDPWEQWYWPLSPLTVSVKPDGN
ncbi:MAG: family lipolytic protein [Sediminibacterium sp.]|nr:family lipolytic protein [Sediminibacterium sp.]